MRVVMSNQTNKELLTQLRSFWELEHIGITEHEPTQNQDEVQRRFKETVEFESGKTSAVAKQLLRDIIQALRSPPLPKPVHQQVHQERRMARAMTLTKRHASDARTDHVDVAKYPHRPNTYTAAVNAADAGVLITSGSVRCKSPTQAEEFAIALAMAIPDRRTVLSDS
ncbi:hypothetical protein MRX96_038220 [Rhipicephalus microplus]